MRLFLLIFLSLTIVGPIWVIASGKIDFHADWRTANRASANLAPDPKIFTDAIIQIYAAPAFNWRGIFAVHTWIAVKAKNSEYYTVYDVIGWRVLRNLPAFKGATDVPDRYWFGHKPQIVYDLRGAKAEEIIPLISAAATKYPYPNIYDAWPGPNSNTFTAFIAREIPAMNFALPSNALGKDFLPNHRYFALAPSGTGYQISLNGLLGIMLARQEGIEINILGLVYGIGFKPFCLKLPGVGDICAK